MRIKTIQLDDQLDTIKRLKSVSISIYFPQLYCVRVRFIVSRMLQDLSAERDKSKELAKSEDENNQLKVVVYD